jgi:hypothetical protein
VIGVKPGVGVTLRVTPFASVNTTHSHALHGDDATGFAPALTTSTLQPSGKKSHAVFSLGCGMPGVSGDANMRGPPTSGFSANEPGVVTPRVLPGLRAPWRGSVVMVYLGD